MNNHVFQVRSSYDQRSWFCTTWCKKVAKTEPLLIISKVPLLEAASLEMESTFSCFRCVISFSENPKLFELSLLKWWHLRSLISSIVCEGLTCHRNDFPLERDQSENEIIPLQTSRTEHYLAKTKDIAALFDMISGLDLWSIFGSNRPKIEHLRTLGYKCFFTRMAGKFWQLSLFHFKCSPDSTEINTTLVSIFLQRGTSWLVLSAKKLGD